MPSRCKDIKSPYILAVWLNSAKGTLTGHQGSLKWEHCQHGHIFWTLSNEVQEKVPGKILLIQYHSFLIKKNGVNFNAIKEEHAPETLE